MKTRTPFSGLPGLPPRLTRVAAALCVCLTAARATATTYYVNDATTPDDVYCIAPGSEANDGLTPAEPVASLQTILDRYTLISSDTVYIDAGTYHSLVNTVIDLRHGGALNSLLTLQGAGRATVLDRQSGVKGDCCLENRANFIRIQGLTFTGADVGLSIDASSCSHAEILDNTFFDNSGAALMVQPGANPLGGSFMIARNLLYNNRDGMCLEPQTITFKIINNTLLGNAGTALLIGGSFPGSDVRNNIVVANGGGICLESLSGGTLFQSDYNDLWATGAGAVARVKYNGDNVLLTTLADWQRFTQASFNGARDTHSFSRDPAFASVGEADFHLKSTGGRWLPAAGSGNGGVWVIDSDTHSPCVDAADTSSHIDDMPLEPAPNGGRKNMGAYGGTSQASKSSPGRTLLAMAPDLGQVLQQPQPIYWSAAGMEWSASDTVRLEYSLSGDPFWTAIGSLPAINLNGGLGLFEWLRPGATFGRPDGCQIRIVSDATPQCQDTAILPFIPSGTGSDPTEFYVNDTTLDGDVWCVAAGDDANDGLSGNTPMATVQAVIERYRPGIGATIYVDAGTYLLSDDLVLPSTGSGGFTNAWFRLLGAGRKTVLNRQTAAAGSCCLRVLQDFAQIKGFVFRGAETGLLIDPSTCRNANIANNTFTANGGYGLTVLPDTLTSGFDTYEIRNNLLYGNGSGMNLQAGAGFHLAKFIVVNNTVAADNGVGIACGGRLAGTYLYNNIVSAQKGTSCCLSVDTPGALAGSDYNDFFSAGGGDLVRGSAGTASFTVRTLADWQALSMLDASSMSRKPLFVSPPEGDYHEASAVGSWHGGAWAPDTETSPCIDAGSPSSDYGGEPGPNGGRVNMGAYGNTPEASRSASPIVIRPAVTFYVNDAATNGDRFCSAPGASANTGRDPLFPLPSLGDVLSANTLGPGDTVYVDTGNYLLPSNAVIDARNKGTADLPIRIIGARGGAVLLRSPDGTDRRCLEIHADHIRVEGLTCMGADTGISVDSSAARHAQLVGNICRDNTAHGIEVMPYGSITGEEYQLLQNVIFDNGDGLFLQGGSGTADSRAVFIIENNTLRNGGPGITLLNTNRRGNQLKNNIIETTGAQAACIVAIPNSLFYSDYNNLRAPPDGYVGAWQSGTAGQAVFPTLAEWRGASGHDKKSISLDSRFMNPDEGNFRLLPGSPCVDAGIISFWMSDATDADGNPRITGQTAEIGAYEMNVRPSIRLFLQGPFLSGTDRMSRALAQSGALPLKSPYADDPRSAAAIPPNAIDWVLVQFRDGPDTLNRSMFLRDDGWLVNEAGSAALDVNLSPNAAYHVVVKHRNHLAAMSATPVTFAEGQLSYDFTASPGAYFGGLDGCVAVTGASATFWALRSGDADGDGAVLPVDQTLRDSQTPAVGYRRGDLNLSGAVTLEDVCHENLFHASPVPHPETTLQPALRVTPSFATLTNGQAVILAADVVTATSGVGAPLTNGGIALTDGPASLPADSLVSWALAQTNSVGTLVPTNAVQALYTAGGSGGTDVVEAWSASDDRLGRAFMNVISTQTVAAAGKALVIAGRRSADDTLWPTTDYLADNAYTTLRYRGFSDENILYLNPDLAQDVDGDATVARTAFAFTNEVMGAVNLFVYLVDHGGNSSGNGYFRLSASETVTATQLDAWLDSLQDASNTKVTVLLDFCYAGSFLRELTYTGTNAQRVVVAACGTNEPTYFVAGGLVSYSGAFFSGVMLGYDVMQCFGQAQSAMSTYQTALFDDDTNGVYTAGDGAVATGTFIGPTFVAPGDAPAIGEVCGNQVLTSETAASLWIGSVSSRHAITRAWCLLVPPGLDPDPDNPVTGLPQLGLTYDADSGRYAVTYDGFTTPGTYTVTFYVQDAEGNVSAPRSSSIAQIGYDDRVILVAAGETNSPAWPAICYLSQLAYATLSLRLFPSDHIRYLSPSAFQDLDLDGTSDVSGPATLANLQSAIAAWAVTNTTDRLTLYVVGEGFEDTLKLNGAESLTTNSLAAWIHDYQVTNPVPVNIVLDFSGSGAFVPALADPLLTEDTPEATRITMASARAGCQALFSNGGAVSFSQYLLSSVISGATLGDAFTAARRAIRRVSGSVRQQAQLDDTLDGLANQKDADGLLAKVTYLGATFVTEESKPVIGAVIPPTVLAAAGTPVTLWAQNVAGMNAISNVWCVVTPPGNSEAADQPELTLGWNATSSRYEVTCVGFVLPGTYALTFYAQDAAGEISDPVQSEIILADAFESDGTPGQASLYDGIPQIHNFHTATDEDWVRVFLVTNFVYEIETYHHSVALDTVIDLYRQLPDGTLEPLPESVDEAGSDMGEYTGLDFPQSGWYWARLSPFSGGTNCIGTYEFSIEIPAAGSLNSLVVLGINDVYASALPTGATATVSGQGSKSFGGATSVVFTGLTNGTYLVAVPTPTNFFPREDPNVPYQVQSLTNLYYANPRQVAVSGGWRMAGFEMLSAASVTSGIVRDAWTRAYLANAQIAFTAASGSLTGTNVDGSVILTSYRTNWLSAADGRLPPTITLGSCNWNLSVSLSGYQTYLRNGAVSNVQAGAKIDLGTAYLVPTDTNANQVADDWEDRHFPGGMVAAEDSDGDGVDNRGEYLCGTDPNNPTNVLRFVDVSAATGTLSMTWCATNGRSYQIVAATSLQGSAWASTNGPWEAAATNATLQWTDTDVPLRKTRFYRVRLNGS